MKSARLNWLTASGFYSTMINTVLTFIDQRMQLHIRLEDLFFHDLILVVLLSLLEFIEHFFDHVD